MSPSGSRKQISGTEPASIRFWRRASRSSASGVKTEEAPWFLPRRIGGDALSMPITPALSARKASLDRQPGGAPFRIAILEPADLEAARPQVRHRLVGQD